MPDKKRRRRRRRRGGGGNNPGIDREEMAHDYGFTLAFLKSDDELWDLFSKAVKQTWDAGRFVAELKETKWFRQNSASARQMITLKYTDPATYREQVQQMRAQVRDTYGALLGGKPRSGRFVNRLAETALMMGWNESQLTNNITNAVNFRKALRRGNLGGEAAQAKLSLSQAARQYGVGVNNKWMARNVERILDGSDTLDGAISRLKNQSMSRYAAFKDEIRGGATMEEIAAPYVQTMSELLEINPSEIDMFNSKVQKALQSRDDEGRPRPLTLYQFEDVVRQDGRWLKTDNAKEQFATLGNDLLRSFGLIA